MNFDQIIDHVLCNDIMNIRDEYNDIFEKLSYLNDIHPINGRLMIPETFGIKLFHFCTSHDISRTDLVKGYYAYYHKITRISIFFNVM